MAQSASAMPAFRNNSCFFVLVVTTIRNIKNSIREKNYAMRQTLKNVGIFQPTTQDRAVLPGKTPSWAMPQCNGARTAFSTVFFSNKSHNLIAEEVWEFESKPIHAWRQPVPIPSPWYVFHHAGHLFVCCIGSNGSEYLLVVKWERC